MLVVKNLPANAEDVRDLDSTPGSRRSPGGGHSSPLQYSCLESPTDRESGGLQSMGSQESNSTWQLKHHHQEPSEMAPRGPRPSAASFALSDSLS